MHGYQFISTIRRDFHVYFGPSTVYPALHALEAKGYIKSTWNLSNDRPRKVYEITLEGERLLSFLESCLGQLSHKMSMAQTEKKPVLVKA
jgi:DNA-binding PadR family transcriptional regulator